MLAAAIDVHVRATPHAPAVVTSTRTETYGELAALAGHPGAARAAGTFCARCDLAPFLPLHRVVSTNGLGSGGELGVEYKRRLLELEHVGSTSVPGLTAKPRLDLQLVVADSADEAAYVPALEAAGYTLTIREPDWHEHRLLRGSDPAVNLHVFSAGCEEIDRVLRFRDRLRSDDADRELYASTKRELARQPWQYVQNYADAKSAVIEEILLRS